MDLSFFTTLQAGWLNAWIPSFGMVLIQFIYMAIFREGGKRAVDTSWYTAKDKWNGLASTILQILCWYFPSLCLWSLARCGLSSAWLYSSFHWQPLSRLFTVMQPRRPTSPSRTAYTDGLEILCTFSFSQVCSALVLLPLHYGCLLFSFRSSLPRTSLF